MKGRGRHFLAGTVIVMGLLMIAYPWISNYLMERQVESEIKTWQQDMEEKKEDGTLQELWKEAEAYNEQLARSRVQLTDPFQPAESEDGDLIYEQTLTKNVEDAMCFVEIPSIDVYLPVFHGTSADVLEKGIGHLEGSALPIGGAGNHSILSGHTGLNTARLFTDLVQVQEEDVFFVHVLGETLAYRVDQIHVIEPEDTSCLGNEEGRDLVSLITCTPYGLNTHRLVVTGERTTWNSSDMLLDSDKESLRQNSSHSNSLWMSSYRKALALGCGIVWGCILLKVSIQHLCRKKRGRRKKYESEAEP